MITSVSGGFICSVCGKEEQDDYDKVWDYINKYGPSSIYVIHIATGVSEEVIKELLDQGRLGAIDEEPPLPKCERCGRDIRSGRLCLFCMKDEVNRLKNFTGEGKIKGQNKEDPRTKGVGMRYFGKERHVK